LRKKILFTGGSGLLALNWAYQIRNSYDIFLGLHEKIINVSGVTSVMISLENEVDFLNSIQNIKPDLIIHTAGMTNVDLCEADPNMASKINFEAVKYVSNVCSKNNIDLIFISTDHLFNGEKSFVEENQLKSPINWYGRTKSLGEDYITENNPNSLIIRTNFFGWGTSYRQSFSDFIINSLSSGKNITLFHDIYYTPILIDVLVINVMNLYLSKAIGIFNVVSSERISKFEFGLMVADIFGLDASLILKGKIEDRLELVQRPKDLSLSNLKLVDFLKTSIPSIKDQVLELKKQEKKFNF
jgi:dTDP-4-dehydrorhamnose reductase